MIFINSVTNSLLTTLSSDATLVSSNVVVDLYLIQNTNPHKTPFWINILQPDISINGWRANIINPWKAEYTLPMITQVQDYGNVENRFQALRDLDELNNHVFTAINSNRTLDNTVNLITGWNITPLDRDDTQSDDFLMCQISLTAEVFA